MPSTRVFTAATRSLFGRADECAELVGGLERATQGQGELFLVSGEAGIGKTQAHHFTQEQRVATGCADHALFGL